jgi:hypothetical protein
MLRFKLGLAVGFLAGWAVGSGRAAQLLKQLQAARDGSQPGAVAARVPRPAFDRSSSSAAVSA